MFTRFPFGRKCGGLGSEDRPEVAATRVVLASPSSSMLPSFPNSKGFNLMLFKKLDKGYASMRYN